MPETIDLPKARELLARAVETQGRDFVYNPGGLGACQYTPDTRDHVADKPQGKTPCLVGVALDLNGETRHKDFSGSVGLLAEAYPDMMTTRAARYFASAQGEQDNGSNWGEAHDVAEEYATTGQMSERNAYYAGAR